MSMHSTQAGAKLELGEFTRGVAHELASPLNAISLNVELARLLLDRGDTVRLREILERLGSDCQRCERLIRGLQRFGSGLHAYVNARVSMRSVADGAVALFAREHPSAVPEITVTAAELWIDLDQPAVERALTGLLHNAAEANATSIEIHVRSDGDFAVVEVCDDGEGIRQDVCVKAAEPFYTTKRATGAIGLGLTLVRELLRADLGEMQIAANEPRGTRVSLRLPGAQVSAAPAGADA